MSKTMILTGLLLLLVATPAVACSAGKAPHRADAHAKRCAQKHQHMPPRSRHRETASCAMMKAGAMSEMAMMSGGAMVPQRVHNGPHVHDHGKAPAPK